MAIHLPSITSQLARLADADRWLIAYSGGIDSHVLLHLLSLWPEHPPLLAIHINHQLQKEADQWADHCSSQAKYLNVPIEIVPVDVHSQPGQSLEEKARRARYQVFEEMMNAGDVLMMAHHQDDQVETLMLRLLRGGGSKGLAGMPAQRALGKGTLFRPLLVQTKNDLVQYAQQHELRWVEDPSNQQTEFDRNFLRQQVLPLIEQRWPGYRQTIARAASQQSETAELIEELAALDLTRLGISSASESIRLESLMNLSIPRQKNLLRYWLQLRGLAVPSASQLQALFDDVINAREDADPLLSWGRVEARRFQGQLYCMRSLSAVEQQASYAWDINQALQIAGVGQLRTNSTISGGLLRSHLANQQLTVRFRQGGERCRPAGRAGSQTLKKLFQEYRLETWWRDRTPLIYCGDELVAVADLWVCEGWQANEGVEGLAVIWDKA